MNDLKAVIFCGGKGTRIREMTEFMAKPMVPIGGKPILWHILKTYGKFGVKNFVLTLGYKGETIKNYFTNYHFMLNDYTYNLKSGAVKIHSDHVEDWTITFSDTGLDTETGERLLNVEHLLDGQDRFMATYGDGLANIDLNRLLEFHLKHGKIATVTGGHGYHKYGLLENSGSQVTKFSQKPRLPERINIGFMVFERAIFRYLKPGIPIEDALTQLAEEGELMMFPHGGFFHPMDTLRDYEELNALWNEGKPPWKIW